MMTSIILLSIIYKYFKTQENVHKSCENVSFCFCTEKNDVAKNVYEVDQELGSGELSPSVCPAVGNTPPQKKTLQMPGAGA